MINYKPRIQSPLYELQICREYNKGKKRQKLKNVILFLIANVRQINWMAGDENVCNLNGLTIIMPQNDVFIEIKNKNDIKPEI